MQCCTVALGWIFKASNARIMIVVCWNLANYNWCQEQLAKNICHFSITVNLIFSHHLKPVINSFLTENHASWIERKTHCLWDSYAFTEWFFYALLLIVKYLLLIQSEIFFANVSSYAYSPYKLRDLFQRI